MAMAKSKAENLFLWGGRGRINCIVVHYQKASGGEIAGVRQLLGESQAEFSRRFGRCERTQRRWEGNGFKFRDYVMSVYPYMNYLDAWRDACREACQALRGQYE